MYSLVLGFSPVLLQAFSTMLGYSQLDIMYIIYNIFLCLFHRRSDLEHAAGMSCSQARGLDNKNYSTWLLWLACLAGSRAGRRKTTRCWLMWRLEAKKKFDTVCHDFRILNSKSWNLDSRLGGYMTCVIDGLFLNFWKAKRPEDWRLIWLSFWFYDLT